METLFGSSLLSKSGEVSTADALAGKAAVGIYFSAHWCPPCRGFTPKLAEWYQKDLQGKGLEIVFVSSDRDEAAFSEYFAEQPWLALPYSARETKDQLSKKFKVQGIPSFVIVDSAGSTITTDGRSAVCEDPQGNHFPWKPRSIREIFESAKFKTQGSDPVDASTAFAGKTAIGLYFSAHWCPPCRGFTPKLAEWYKKDLKEKGLEIVFVSSDRDESAFNDYFSEQPWLALDYSDRNGKNDLSKVCGVEGIPSLAIIDPIDFSIINTEGREAASSDPEGNSLPWKPKAVRDLAAGPGPINEVPMVLVFCETSDPDEQDKIEDALKPISERYLEEGKAKGESPEVAFTMAKSSAGLSGRIRSMVSLEQLPPAPHEHPMEEAPGDAWGCDGCNQSGSQCAKRFRCTQGCDFDFCGDCYEKAMSGAGKLKLPPRMVLLDIPSDGAFYAAEEAGITTAVVEKFIADYQAGRLERKQLG
mmetsp:Transcript_87333/g.219810  ORF Transcript_87333/g.219810 Transcript_87333/m.219810 type:complete len:474 (-) Transcript_87333:212-1633(-)|eukprot:CAMPEP_0115220388 /NCGR_PEP_ID=MMETSP0270-20121206/27420_1 /TAXON_ID=71861 /ORGANISM="Scrippsiella trochoidea, Strain CCMP3099" /LENGTH=473 /DNA_ID=CAMNT_0002634439 /DNA_START=77 /DNA_END=1498 /DNA_ORIENTATION=-